MARIVIIGNSGGGKSTLARRLAGREGIPHIEIDRLLWQEGWRLTPTEVYERQHEAIIQGDSWIIDGLGQQASIQRRISRATTVILIDMPLWVHFWLAADRQIAWASGQIQNAPGGISEMPPTKALFQNIWEVARAWMPSIRVLCDEAERKGTTVIRLEAFEELTAFAGE